MQEFFSNKRIVLAPMAGFTDMPFRSLCFDEGLFLGYTEMVSAKGLIMNKKPTEATLRLLCAAPGEKRIMVQLFGSDPYYMAEAAKRLEEGLYTYEENAFKKADLQPYGIDINMGCPAPKIVKNGEGAALMRDEKRVFAVVNAVKKATSLPVTAKMRLGWEETSENYLAVARACEEAGIDAICLHARYRAQFYAGKANWEAIARLKRAAHVPVIGNGDIYSPEDAASMLAKTGCDAVMVGRGAMGNPFIFAQTEALLAGREYQKADAKTRMHAAKTHMHRLIGFVGERMAILQMRKHLGHYIKGIRHAAGLRASINMCKTACDMEKIIDDVANSI